jgi:hypothetical protein
MPNKLGLELRASTSRIGVVHSVTRAHASVTKPFQLRM